MSDYQSNITHIPRKIEEVFQFLTKPSNFEALMPEQVKSFEATEQEATIKIDGIGTLVLAITETIPPNKIVMQPQNKVPFDFKIWWELQATGEVETKVQVHIDAKLNFMMKMMAEGFLKKFLNIQIDKLGEHISRNT
jgi:carbon monoxide dehydrogenase subunit G